MLKRLLATGAALMVVAACGDTLTQPTATTDLLQAGTIPSGGNGNGATFSPDPFGSITIYAGDKDCRVDFGTEGNFILTTPSGNQNYKERGHDVPFTVSDGSTGAVYVGTGNYNWEGDYPDPPFTMTATAKVTNTADPSDVRQAVCKWLSGKKGDRITIKLNG